MAAPANAPSCATKIPLVELVRRAELRGLHASLRDPSGTAGRTVVGAVRLDSRLVTGGDLFVAVPGSRVDGATFVAEAVGRGAAAVVCDRGHAPADLPAVVTDDVA